VADGLGVLYVTSAIIENVWAGMVGGLSRPALKTSVISDFDFTWKAVHAAVCYGRYCVRRTADAR